MESGQPAETTASYQKLPASVLLQKNGFLSLLFFGSISSLLKLFVSLGISFLKY